MLKKTTTTINAIDAPPGIAKNIPADIITFNLSYKVNN